MSSALAAPADVPAEQVEALEQIRDRLLAQLRWQREAALDYYAWYEGTQPLPGIEHPDWQTLYGRMRDMARGGWASLIVDSISERLEIQGVRSTVGPEVDDEAWALLQASHVDADQKEVHTEALVVGRSYVSVSDLGGSVRVAPESALDVTHESVPGNPRIVAAALKVLELAPGVWQAELLTREWTATWLATYARAGRGSMQRTPLIEGARPSWTEPELASHEPATVPIVPFINRSVGARFGRSELARLIPIMNRLQDEQLAKVIAMHTAVFRQKWMTGVAIPTDPETGERIEPFKSATDKLWSVEAPDARFGSFEATDIGQYLRAIDADVAELAAVSKVPSYYLVQTDLANPPSAESLTASESGLVEKCRDRQAVFGEAWEQVVRLALGVGAGGSDAELEVLWRDAERRAPSIVADSATKLASIGVPQEALWSYVGFSPQAIERMRVMKTQEELAAALAAPAAPPVPA